MPTFLTRRVTFAAAHRYRRPEWSEEENARVFGLCARENYHGHSYVCEVTVTGDVDPRTGMLVDLAVLDRVLDAEVRSRFDHRNVNLDVPEFADGKRIPTGEELAPVHSRPRAIRARVGARGRGVDRRRPDAAGELPPGLACPETRIAA